MSNINKYLRSNSPVRPMFYENSENRVTTTPNISSWEDGKINRNRRLQDQNTQGERMNSWCKTKSLDGKRISFRDEPLRRSSESSKISMDDMQEMYRMVHDNKEELLNEIENMKENHKKEMNELKREMRNVETEMTNQNLRLYDQINYQREEMAAMNDNQSKFLFEQLKGVNQQFKGMNQQIGHISPFHKT